MITIWWVERLGLSFFSLYILLLFFEVSVHVEFPEVRERGHWGFCSPCCKPILTTHLRQNFTLTEFSFKTNTKHKLHILQPSVTLSFRIRSNNTASQGIKLYAKNKILRHYLHHKTFNNTVLVRTRCRKLKRRNGIETAHRMNRKNCVETCCNIFRTFWLKVSSC